MVPVEFLLSSNFNKVRQCNCQFHLIGMDAKDTRRWPFTCATSSTHSLICICANVCTCNHTHQMKGPADIYKYIQHHDRDITRLLWLFSPTFSLNFTYHSEGIQFWKVFICASKMAKFGSTIHLGPAAVAMRRMGVADLLLSRSTLYNQLDLLKCEENMSK